MDTKREDGETGTDTGIRCPIETTNESAPYSSENAAEYTVMVRVGRKCRERRALCPSVFIDKFRLSTRCSVCAF